MYSENTEWNDSPENYRVCSKIETRMITPQLARNLIQNGKRIKSADGWAPKAIYTISDDDYNLSTSIKIDYFPPIS
jgi:hypothetical protein